MSSKLCLFLVAVLGGHLSILVVAAEGKILAETACLSRGNVVNFIFSEETIDPLEKADIYEKMTIFRIERDHGSSAENRELIWQNETCYLAAVPWPLWSASLVCDPSGDGVHVILVYNRGVTDISIDLYYVSAEAPAISEVLWASPSETPSTPELRVKSLSSYVGRLRYESGGVKAIEATLTDGRLAVGMALRNKRLGPVHFEIDLQTKEIRRIQEDPPAQKEGSP